ncbi:uncharacterized protein LOC133171872 [Saccostrea echinata]|uniref:uncharacterized protein LOC133171872 n=1 Tax=Saccostrea echinata TaxID=191078 RepID=UPI002A805839|nr:uncharacterized protein LOC133171872 [Saccostrea echinata]
MAATNPVIRIIIPIRSPEMMCFNDKREDTYFHTRVTKHRVWTYFAFNKLKDGPATKANLDMTKAVCRLCIKEYSFKVGKVLPISLVDSEYFQHLVNLWNPKYEIPSRKTITTKLAQKKDEMKVKLIGETGNLDDIV